jgi:glucans biosynthesis protein
LQISTFVDNNPKGFGFLQRDRDFENYLDDDQHWEKRPSLWIEPIGDWAEGVVELIEIPSDSENNDNIIAFWKPKQALAPGSETAFAYRQFWGWNPPERPAFATVTLCRQGRGSAAKRRRFLVEYAGDVFAVNDQGQTLDIKINLSATHGAITSLRAFLAKDRKSYRVLFELDPGSELSSEMRLVLERDGHPISETWYYRWTP